MTDAHDTHRWEDYAPVDPDHVRLRLTLWCPRCGLYSDGRPVSVTCDQFTRVAPEEP